MPGHTSNAKEVEAAVVLAAIDSVLAEKQKKDPWFRLTAKMCCDLPTGECNYGVGNWAKKRRPNSTDPAVLQRRAKLTDIQRAHLDRLYTGTRGNGQKFVPSPEQALRELEAQDKVLRQQGLRLTTASTWVATWGQPWMGGRWAGNRSSRNTSEMARGQRAKLTRVQLQQLDKLFPAGGRARTHYPAASPRLSLAPTHLGPSSPPPLPPGLLPGLGPWPPPPACGLDRQPSPSATQAGASAKERTAAQAAQAQVCCRYPPPSAAHHLCRDPLPALALAPRAGRAGG